MPRDLSRSPSYRRRYSPSPVGHRYSRRSRRDRSRSPYSSSYSRRKSRSITPRRRKSRSPSPRRRRSPSSPIPRRYKRQRSRSSSLSSTRKSASPSFESTERNNANEKLRKDEEEKKRYTQNFRPLLVLPFLFYFLDDKLYVSLRTSS